MRSWAENPILNACRGIALLAAGMMSLSPAFAAEAQSSQAGDYLLGTLDKVRVTISDGTAATAEGGLRPQIDGIFAIGADGTVPLPLIGPVRAAGRSPSALAGAISEQFRTRLGTIDNPSTSVEITEYRPFYIVGLVNQPGSHQYRPGMIVLHAIGIAGGLLRPQDSGAMRLERDIISAKGDVRSYDAARLGLLVKIARLQAEAGGASTIAVAGELRDRADAPAATAALRDEQAFLANRQASLKERVAEQTQLKDLGQKRLAALKAEEEAQLRLLSLLKAEVGDQKQFVARGISTAQRTTTMEARLAEAEARRRQIEGDAFSVAQEIVKAEHAIEALQNTRRDDLLKELKDAQAKLEEVEQKAQTARQLSWDGNLTVGGPATETLVAYSIFRPDGNAMREISATEISAVQPGDIVKVGRVDVSPARVATTQKPEPVRREAAETRPIVPRM
jgi:polysaccharide export outer membrane protein/exopolysaccharide production protein ExoF